ncbi:phosphoglycolate phosphatase-like HAD superfamily hydrolase [Saccharothrix ecbatanensis]|uniref:Phosphoglycolate phosphatase-like HAD superfamily hydrolase n=1 Tax=Saccharothrix ecbatanensis TaxID=1105145 RepID=A0A7W9LZH7_9PSEU|nr:HAD family hydrolase [Saccharothrix ecbatanensis]MBB5801880.1 phosphoglycolate phosphatase-like HAD superfamily hydrolase [Saccharothrix ecbatanensis]
MTGRVLALDFDGVVCDALAECALITWFGVHRHDCGTPGSEHLEAVPGEFVARFRKVRDYARLLDHFVVAHHPEADAVVTQREFDALFASIDPVEVAAFTEAAGAARAWLREREPEFWLDLHTLYPGLPEALRRHAGSVAIITAKDDASVRAILDRHALGSTVAEVYGECGAKADAVRDLAARRGVDPSSVIFVDDNLANVRRVAETGARALWAQWGYQIPEHRDEAARHEVEPLELSALAGI